MSLPDDPFELVSDTDLAPKPNDENQEDFEIDFFGAILERNEEQVDVLRRLVELRARRGDHGKAFALDARLVRLRPRDAIARYNLACSLSMLGDLDAAVVSLRKALELGYCDVAHMEDDPDLDPVREHPEYLTLLETYGFIDF